MHNESEDIEKLRGLLLGDQQKTVVELKQRLSNRFQRTQDSSEILADTIRLAQEEDADNLKDALSKPVLQSIKSAIENNPKKFADAIYPSMLPAIRRAVQELSRQFVERIDSVVTQSISLEHFKWRIESWRTGVPLTEIILRESIDYKIEQLLLIQNSSGLLQAHSFREDAEKTDSDAVSGMLWAIESFVRDSFNKQDESLNRVTMGEFTMYLIRGPVATLASVVKGVAPPAYLKKAKLTLELLHAKHSSLLKKQPPDNSFQKQYREQLDKLLVNVKSDTDNRKNSFKNAKIILLLLLLSALILSSIYYLNTWKMNRLLSEIDSLPGISILKAEKNWGKWKISALEDPSAESIESFFEKRNFDSNKITFKITPFLSLDSELLLKRINHHWKIPASVSTEISQGVLALTGTAPVDWYVGLREIRMLPQGIEAIDSNKVTLEAANVVKYIESDMSFPDTVRIRQENGSITISGQANKEWISDIQQYVELFGDKVGFNLKMLSPD